jgi:hypothetical protein
MHCVSLVYLTKRSNKNYQVCVCVIIIVIVIFPVISLWQSLVPGTYIAVVILTKFVQWLRLALSKGPNWLGVLSPPPTRLQDVNRSSFQNIVFSSSLEYRTMDKVQNLGNSACYTPSSEPFGIYLERQNLLRTMWRSPNILNTLQCLSAPV